MSVDTLESFKTRLDEHLIGKGLAYKCSWDYISSVSALTVLCSGSEQQIILNRLLSSQEALSAAPAVLSSSSEEQDTFFFSAFPAVAVRSATAYGPRLLLGALLPYVFMSHVFMLKPRFR